MALLIGAPSLYAATVVTNNVVSQASQAQNNVPVTFGQVFKAGDVPAGTTLTASINGQPVTLQVDSKATNPDGSLRHAVLTAIVPSLQGSASQALTLASTASPARQSASIALSQLLATNYDAQVALTVNGQPYTASARKLLQTAASANACASWNTQCNLWLSGPLASEWVVNGLVTAADGTPNPNLRIYFSVRAYAGTSPGSVGDVRTDIIVENTSAFAPQAQPQYTATLTSGSASYTSPALTQYAYTRWHKQLWWNNVQPQVYLQQDTQYIQASKAVSRYMPLTPDESFLAGLRQSCAPLDNCDQTKTMANTGAQASIGPLPRWTSVYIVHPDVRAYNWMLANTDALGAYSIHYRDQTTGLPVSIQKHPYVTVADWSWANQASAEKSTKGAAYKADLLQNCFNNAVISSCLAGSYGTGNPNVWDDAHQPAAAYVPYMVTGDYYYMSELAFGASHNELWSNETYRGFSQGLIDGPHGQVRGKAWVLREMADAAWLLPDSHPLQREFTTNVENSLADWNTKYTGNPNANPLGVMTGGTVYSMNGGHSNGMAPWQHNFLTWSVGHAAELGFTGAPEFRNWLAKFEIGLMTDWQHNNGGYCWLDASAYNIQVKDSSGNWLPSYTAAYAATYPTLKALTCNSPAMVAALGSLTGRTLQSNEMTGYPAENTGFPANFQIGVATAADSELPDAHAAWTLFDSRSVKPSGAGSYNNFPNFAVIPRFATSASADTPPAPNPTPPTFTPPTPPAQPTTPPPSTTPSGLVQTLTASEKVIVVGDTFTVAGALNYPDGTTKPVSAYRMYGYNTGIVSSANSYSTTFVAHAVGTTTISNDNGGVTGHLTITVVAAASLPAVPPSLIGQTITISKQVIHVGDTFTVTGLLNYSDGSTKPVSGYRLYGFDSKVVSTPTSYTTTFVARAAGTTIINNDNAGRTGHTSVTVLPAGV
ncbi:hypothetical protein PY254_01400 [Rhodanobacter sp. AS-Z3]|uniref:hypothetical protein n=1 Tax=Rhodanobacter sp. AS-Z3 TaxID=3031330 RepID=UPI0024783AE1|nr:hypothetical protein [Rhodanobacter sp. AS-Z3]WEN15364.1 hypothetical protein PY254_01400 [Rhodanobacter sp. AS-Z3]